MLKDGLSKSAITHKLGINRDTVAKYAKMPEGYIPVIKREAVDTTVNPYLPYIARILEEAHEVPLKGISLKYVRYMDDFICFTKSKEDAVKIKREAIEFVNRALKLGIDNRKVKFQRACHGIVFLGCKITHDKIFISKTKRKKIRHRLKSYLNSSCKIELHHSFVNIIPKDDTLLLKSVFDVYNEYASMEQKMIMLKSSSKKFDVFMNSQRLNISLF